MIELPGYKISKELGVGGQARVYLAEQESFQRQVAVKVLLPQYAEDPDFTERFLREARTVAGLSHPHIIPVYDFGQQNGTYYMAMDFLAGGDLSGRIKQGLSEEEILKITSEIAQALYFLHEKGFVHRDVKPDNIMFREDGSSVLTDFGIARAQDASNQITVVGQVLGTPKYMSPEQLQGRQIDGRSDIYALGIMFYQMFTKQVPYSNKDFMTLAMMHCNDPIPNLPKQFRKYQHMFERMVAKEPEKRFQNGQEIAKLIEGILSGKIDPWKIDSSAAASLKTGDASGVATESLKQETIPYELTMEIQHLDPLLDEDWYPTVVKVFKKLTSSQRKYVYQKHLVPKGVRHDPESKKMVFTGRPGVSDLENKFESPKLRSAAKKLIKAEQTLRTTRDASAFADLMESSLSNIEAIEAGENLGIQKAKNELRQAFLDDLVLIVRGTNFEVPENKRGLTVEAIQAFFIQVFLKQKMQGYYFRTVPLKQLEKDKNDFIRTVVAPEARIRQCDVIRSNGYLFLIGPVRNMDQNPFSVRRFLHEDYAMGGSIVYFNVVVVSEKRLDKEQYREGIQWAVSRIITLERQLSAGVTDLVDAMESAHEKQLAPMLLRPIQSDGTDFEKAVKKRMLEFEYELYTSILSKLPRAINMLARTQDDYEYLFFNLRKIMIQLACDARDFTSKYATAWSTGAQELDLKLVSYLALLERRKDQVFIVGHKEQPDDPLLDPAMPEKEFNNVLDEFEPELDQLKEKLRETIRKNAEPRNAIQKWLDNMLAKVRTPVTPESIQKDINLTLAKCLSGMIRICKRYTKITLYLELEDLVEVDESKRHYALPAGRDGIEQLPALVTLYEDKEDLDIPTIRQAVNTKSAKERWKESGGANWMQESA